MFRLSSSPSILPPYLTSGASSRAHHAFLVKLQEASSEQEEDEIISQEVKRAKTVLTGRNLGTGKIAETLIILLHCWMIRHITEDDLTFALVPALQLAEGGKSSKERRIGYLYLCESLPRDHELRLMFINTIRKDLASPSVQNNMLALHTLIQFPFAELEPAVTPLLISKPLLNHDEPLIRRRSLQALEALHLDASPSSEPSMSKTIGSKSFPLDMGRLCRMLRRERDPSVQRILIELIQTLIETGIHRVKDEEELQYLIEEVKKVSHALDEQIASVVTKCLCQIVRDARVGTSGGVRVVTTWLVDGLNGIRSRETWKACDLLPFCQLHSLLGDKTTSSDLQPAGDILLSLISDLLSPPESSSSTATLPPPNQHYQALRCLEALPVSCWEGSLEEAKMGIIMEGLNARDDSIRRITLRILHRLSPDLVQMTFDNLIDSVKTSTNLCLPPLPPELSMDRKVLEGQRETTMRAIEVAEVVARLGDPPNNSESGQTFMTKIVQALDVLWMVQNERRTDIWDPGAKRVLDFVRRSSPSFRQSSAESLLSPGDVNMQDPTTALVRGIVLCDYSSFDSTQTDEAVTSLMTDIGLFGSHLQELLLVAAVGLLMQLSKQDRRSAEAIFLEKARLLRKAASSSVAFRINDIITIIDDDHLDELRLNAASRTLPDVSKDLRTLEQRYGSRNRADRAASNVPDNSSPGAVLGSLTPSSGLRYGAYDPPLNTKTRKTPQRDRGNGPLRVSFSPPQRGRDPALTAGDFALLGVDDSDAEEVEADPTRSSPNLLRLQIGREGSIGDPFGSDEPRTPT